MLKSPLLRPTKTAVCSESSDNQELSSELRAVDEEILAPGPQIHCESLVLCFSHSYRKRRDTPYHNLMAAVLKSALQDVSLRDKASPVYRDAYKWFNEIFPYAGAYTQHVFSIESICLYLDVDKSTIQRHIKEKYASR